jgi:hypothetical protein
LVATTASVLRPWPPGIRENKTDAVALHTPSVREFKKLACWFSEKSWRYGAEVLGCDNRLCVAAMAARVREDRTYAVFGAPTSSRSSQDGRGQINEAGIPLGAGRCGGTWLRQPPSRCGRLHAHMSWELALWRERMGWPWNGHRPPRFLFYGRVGSIKIRQRFGTRTI